MKRRILLCAYGIIAFTLFVPTYAFAYIDPATTSYIIQLVAGLVISLSVAFGVFFKRIQMGFVTVKAKAMATFKRITMKHAKPAGKPGAATIAANRSTAKNQVTKPAANSAAMYRAEAEAASKATCPNKTTIAQDQPVRQIGGAINWKNWEVKLKAKKKQEQKQKPFSLINWLFADTRTFKQRLVLAILLPAALAITYCICVPLDIFVANMQFIPYRFNDILPYILLAGLAALLVMAFFLIISRGRVFDFIASLFFGTLIMLWVQGSFLNPGLGLLTGDTINWSAHTTRAIVTSIICLALLVAPFVINKLSKKAWKSILVYASSLMIAIQIISILTVTSASGVLNPLPTDKSLDSVLTNQALFEVSPNKNIIVLLLDRTDGSMMNAITADDPAFFDGKLDGFTSFTNYNSYYNLTFPSVCNLLTGAKYDFSAPTAPSNFMDKAYAESHFFSDLADAGWSNYVYLDRYFSYYSASGMADDVVNVSNEQPKLKPVVALKKLYKITGLVYAPQVIKPNLWTNTSEFYAGIDYGSMYTLDDHAYYSNLKQSGLTQGTDDKRFTFIHLSGSHAPFTWDKNMQATSPQNGGSELLQSRAAYTIAFEYLDQLKSMGLYENSTIIITSDHGSKYSMSELPNSTCLFVKPAGKSTTPLNYNAAPVTFENFRATVIDAAGGDTQTYGDTFFEVPEDLITTRELNFRYNPRDKEGTWNFVFKITGDMNNINNWELVREFEFDYGGEVGGM